MATRTDKDNNITARTLAPLKHLDADVTITAPVHNARLDSSFTVTGVAQCVGWTTGENEERIEIGDETGSITAVDVRLGGDASPFQRATPTGPSSTPWASWTFAMNTTLRGSLALTARVSAARPTFSSDTDTHATQVIVDITPPTLAVNPPANVTSASPPYTGTITGTAADDGGTGVATVEWRLGGSGAFQAAAGTTSWSAAVPLPGLGAHTVTIRARDSVDNVSPTQSVTVNVIDATGPALSIVMPSEGEIFTLTGSSVSVEVRGTASDTQTGVAVVEWALDGQAQFTSAIPRAANDWSTWSAQIPITVAGNHTITIRAKDKVTPAANLTTQLRFVVVAQPFDPKDREAVFSAAAFLDDLLDFATRRAKTAATGGVLISRQLLVDTFLQPFTDLVTRNNRLVANQSVHQVRLCIEGVRRYLAKHGRTAPATAEATYRQAAYVALLRGLGTSYEEIRLARVAENPARAALASRLGIDLTQFRPDRLDQLLLQPAQVTEVALKNLFGLEETTLKPLADSVLPEPQLLIWQKERLRAMWQQQDEAARSVVDTPVPVIDPDLLYEGDLRTPVPGNAAYDLWKARQQHVATELATIKARREAQPTQAAGFSRIIADTLGPIAALLALTEEYQRGNPIDAQLKALKLTLQPFFHLMRVHKLALAGSVLDTEWDDVYAILVQVRKFLLHATWRSEERQRNLSLSQDYFQLPVSDTPPPPVALPRWRATPQVRQNWRRTLEARLQQEQVLTQALQSVVDAAEEETLPLLRDAFIAAIDPSQDASVVANRLSQEVAIDCKSSGRQKTTRVQQALETLQDVMFSLRTGRFKTMPPVLGTTNPAANWVLALDPARPYTEADFDEEWRWMGAYATWHAAIRVFAYPESYLLPELRPPSAQTEAFRTLMQTLRDQPRLTPSQARTLAGEVYLKKLTTDLGETLPASLRYGSLVITELLSDTQLVTRRGFIQTFFSGITNPHLAPNYLKEIFYFVPMALALQLQKSGQYLVALDWIETFYTDHLAINERKIYRGLTLEETIPTQYQRNPDAWLRVGLNPHEIVTVRASAYTRFTLMALVRCYLDFADAEFTRDSSESISRARSLYTTALELLALPEFHPPSGATPPNPFPPNPVPQALQLHAELNLFKLRSGRNIAGIERQSAPESLPAVTLGTLPVASDGARNFRPTPYRYSVLVERAKALVGIAQQVEGAFLAALEKRDAETYNLLKAGHDLQLSEATVDLQALRVTEAEGGVKLAELQQARAATQRDTYQGYLDAGLNQWESGMLRNYEEGREARQFLAFIEAELTTAQAMTTAAAGGISGGAAAGPAAAFVGLLSVAKADRVSAANDAESAAQVNSANASFERRKQEWEMQHRLAERDVAIGEKQVELARTHTGIVQQEQSIAQTQHDQAQATVEFLANKFTNAELYAWMSGILGGAYSYFLQQATAMAQLAQYQLAFERQETPPDLIKADYWETPGDTATPAGGQGTEPDRRGLTGSVRLLQDITRLDQFAFETNKRKLQLAQTFSLAQLLPAEFQRFRETGSLSFATPMAQFDEGFPGHYLRLIERVRVSIVALIPPTRGVRATLIASGVSRVVTGGDVFQTIVVRRDPELIAITSPSNATGLLELEPEGELLRPFESMGVDTNWELQLPRPANPFDYRTIADVLFTVEYTALQSFTYRQQVIQELDDTVSAERAFSLRDQFADQWYALHNSTPGTTPAVRFTLTDQDFPPNLEDVRIQHVLLAVVRAQGRTFEIGDTQLLLTAPGATTPVGGAAGSSIEGVISTRRSNASGWTALIGQSPAGAWELVLPNTQEMKNRFRNEEIDDLLLVLTYAGRTPAWPA